MIWPILLMTMPAADPTGESWERLKARIETAPADVAAFIERRAGCNHFDGEDVSGNPERAEQFEQARREMRCDRVEADEQSLQRAYRGNADILYLLRDTRDLVPG